ncbi:hypothetical protein GUJ93_ZPchr0002g26168 [Zizania palustris]|uniref:Uncharacterized protein n=1 Tax=Zizania palustris TaxID=103762 RepID=A0A8J5RMU8_ZIZPA|nr:hypothetical protein GUJ93_ZPchr0002g26168 [Zizania palustris]
MSVRNCTLPCHTFHRPDRCLGGPARAGDGDGDGESATAPARDEPVIGCSGWAGGTDADGRANTKVTGTARVARDMKYRTFHRLQHLTRSSLQRTASVNDDY